ncbi:hypothetical protein ACOLYJ_002470 [Listeria monocytogenes]
MKLLRINSNDYTGQMKVNRKEYNIMEFRFSDLSDMHQKQLVEEAAILANEVNPHSANEGIFRSLIQRKNDAIAGLLAEYAVVELLNSLSPGSAYRPAALSAKNQIDIVWTDPASKIHSIEVRSSFVNNGLPFGLFAYNHSENTSYFDVLGPYRQESYKKEYESTKDLFFRVLFEGKKSHVHERFIVNDEQFYIIGAMSGDRIRELNNHKSLKPGSAVQKKSDFSGDYYVAPINRIGDIQQFINNFL